MKNIYILILIPLFGLFSCEDLLVEQPKSIAEETFYNTPKEVESALAAIYLPYRGQQFRDYMAMMESYTDYSYGRGSWASNSNFQGLDGTNQPRTATMWDAFYLSIRNANIVIENVPTGKNLTDNDKAKYIGEAKFLRALAYFYLIRNWGGVIIRTENNMKDIEVKRSSASEVYQLIVDDLKFAEENLLDNAPIPGKPSKWAAKTLLADVYFFHNKYTEARDKSKEVILSNKYSLVSVSVPNDFNKIFGPDVITSTEEIFYFKFSKDQSWQFTAFPHHPGAKKKLGDNYYGHYSDLVSNKVIAEWDKNDFRFIYGWYPYNIGLGANTISNGKYTDPTGYGANSNPVYRYADVLLLYAEADCRASGTVSSDAMEKLNMVHRRAYGKNPTIVNTEIDFKISDYNKDSFIELVIKEKGYETQYEGKRWLDLKRTGEVKQRIKAATGKDVADKHLLFPIPPSEYNFNKAIDPIKDQNPGY